MDVWHATVFYHGAAHDEDCVGQDAAKNWAETTLRNLGYSGPVQWRCTDTQCVANQSPDNTAIIRRRANGQSRSSSAAQSVLTAGNAGMGTGLEQDNYLQRLWRGQVPLRVTYWVWGIGVNFVLALLFTFSVTPSPPVRVLYLAYYAFIVVAIWRSSERYQGPKVWSALARISVMLGVAQTALALFLRV